MLGWSAMLDLTKNKSGALTLKQLLITESKRVWSHSLGFVGMPFTSRWIKFFLCIPV